EAIEAVYLRRVAEQRDIEPAAAARTSGHRTVFVSGAANLLAQLCEIFGRERTGTHAGDIGLGNADDAVDFRRCDTCSRTGSAGRGAGASNKRVSAEVNVEHGALRALEQDALTVPNHLVQQVRGIARQRPDLFREGFVLLQDFVEIHLVANMKGVRDELLIFGKRAIELPEVYIDKVRNTYAAARNLVLITRTNAARCGSDGDTVFAPFRNLFYGAVKRKDNVSTVTDFELRFDIDARGFETGDLFQQRSRIYDNSIADDREHARTENAAGDELEDEFFFAYEDRMAGIVATLIASDCGKSFREQIDDLPFTFVAPLRSQDYQITHRIAGPYPKYLIVSHSLQLTEN